MFKSGFFSIVGRPNVGKSTLLNKILKQKVAIVSPKAQTTRNKITGVYSEEGSQIVFIDTPGIHKPQHKLGDHMNRTAWNATRGIEGLLFMVPVDEEFGTGDKFILSNIAKNDTPIYLVISKTDKVSKDKLLAKIEELKNVHEWKDIIPISSVADENVDKLLTVLKGALVEGPQYYPDGMISDSPEKFIIAETIREKVLHLTEQEIPHSIAVVIDKLEARKKGSIIDVVASVVVERDSQKGIVIGKQASMIKEIGRRARKDIENILGSKVYLETYVKVKKNWRNKLSDLETYGYSKNEF